MRFAAVTAAAVVASVAFGAGVRNAAAKSASGAPAPASEVEAAASCEVGGLTPGRTRDARPASHQIRWNPVDAAELELGGEMLELKLEGAGGVLRGEVAYELTEVQLRRRAHSRRYPVEARFIHEASRGDQVVVGLYLTEGAANPGLEPLRAAVEAGDAEAVRGVDMRELLPADDAQLVYAARNDAGCAPRVTWTVMTRPIEASAEQLDAFAALLPGERS